MQTKIEDLPVETQHIIHEAIRDGRKLDAVKAFYTETKHSLLESKKIIEDEMSRLQDPGRKELEQLKEVAAPDEMDRILDCIFANKKLAAIKIYRTSTGSSLMESKQFVEEVTNQLKQDSPEQFKGGTGFPSGCALLLILIPVVCLAISFGI